MDALATYIVGGWQVSIVSVMLNPPCSGLLVYENNRFLYCFFEFIYVFLLFNRDYFVRR